MAVTLKIFFEYLRYFIFLYKFWSPSADFHKKKKSSKLLTKITWSVGRNDVLTKMNFPLNVDDILL